MRTAADPARFPQVTPGELPGLPGNVLPLVIMAREHGLTLARRPVRCITDWPGTRWPPGSEVGSPGLTLGQIPVREGIVTIIEQAAESDGGKLLQLAFRAVAEAGAT